MGFDLLLYPFVWKALVMGAVLGTLFALIGVFVVSRGMSFFSDFIAHASILGGALALVAGVDSTYFLIPYCLVLGYTVSAVWRGFPLSRDTVLGVFYGGVVALGLLLISVKSLGVQALMPFLFGDILLIGTRDIALAGLLLTAFVLYIGLNFRKLVKATFLPEISSAEGIRVGAYDMTLMGLIAVTIALSIKLVGALLANAMVVIPAATAKVLSRSLKQFLVLAPTAGVLAFIGGTALSFRFDLPSGPSVAATGFALFLVALGLGRALGR